MTNYELNKFIVHALKTGYTPENLRQMLISRGWNRVVVEHGMQDVKREHPDLLTQKGRGKSPHHKARFILTVVPIILLLLILFFFNTSFNPLRSNPLDINEVDSLSILDDSSADDQQGIEGAGGGIGLDGSGSAGSGRGGSGGGFKGGIIDNSWCAEGNPWTDSTVPSSDALFIRGLVAVGKSSICHASTDANPDLGYHFTKDNQQIWRLEYNEQGNLIAIKIK